MDIGKILDNLKNGELVLGPDDGAGKRVYHRSMRFDISEKILKLNTDLDYKMNNKVEEMIKVLYKKFNIVRYQIEVVDSGESNLDLDITLDLNKFEKEKIAEIISFIKDNFYNTDTWISQHLD